MAALSNAPEALAMPGDHASGRRPTRVHALRMAAAFAIAATLVLAIAVSWLGVQDLQLRARVAALEEMRQNQRAMVLSFGLLPGITRAPTGADRLFVPACGIARPRPACTLRRSQTQPVSRRPTRCGPSVRRMERRGKLRWQSGGGGNSGSGASQCGLRPDFERPYWRRQVAGIGPIPVLSHPAIGRSQSICSAYRRPEIATRETLLVMPL